MCIISFLKWFSYIFTGIIVFILLLRFVLSHLSSNPPVNQTTKTCLITGASSGLGRALAVEMVKQGWKVIGIGLRAELLNELQKQLGEQSFIPYVCDVSNREDVHHASDEMKTKGLQPTLFFLNAGIPLREEKGKVSAADHQRIFATNYLGVVVWIDEWLNAVQTYGGGTFVATSSISALASMPNSAAYGASKVALLSCFKSLQLQYKKDNVCFSVVALGEVATETFNPNIFYKIQKGEKLSFIQSLFVHLPEDDARYIVKQVFNGKKQIESSWLCSAVARLISWWQ